MRKLLSLLVIALFFIGLVLLKPPIFGLNTQAAPVNKKATMVALEVLSASALPRVQSDGCDEAKFSFCGSV